MCSLAFKTQTVCSSCLSAQLLRIYSRTHNKPQKYKAYVCVCVHKKLAKKKSKRKKSKAKPESFHLKFKQLLLKSFNFCASFAARVARAAETNYRQIRLVVFSSSSYFFLFCFFFFGSADKFCNEIVSAGFCFSRALPFFLFENFNLFFFVSFAFCLSFQTTSRVTRNTQQWNQAQPN